MLAHQRASVILHQPFSITIQSSALSLQRFQKIAITELKRRAIGRLVLLERFQEPLAGHKVQDGIEDCAVLVGSAGVEVCKEARYSVMLEDVIDAPSREAVALAVVSRSAFLAIA